VSGDGVERLRALLLTNHDGRPLGIPSVCSAEPAVLAAALGAARGAGGIALIESTCNQVNQEGGYTGMTPATFRAQIEQLAAVEGVADASLVLGGDHLGPYPWRAEPAGAAMAKARELVRHCVRAGYGKLHLDASMALGGDASGTGHLAEDVAIGRTVELCAAAEEERRRVARDVPGPIYVIGTDVPVPGGETAGGETAAAETSGAKTAGADGPAPTQPDDVRRFVTRAAEAFAAAGLEEAWGRVAAVVVQPGVEFDEWIVHAYRPEIGRPLATLIEQLPPLVYEAHSTDYQTPAALQALVRDHFAILKVGPALTFAYREALFALEAIERELLAAGLLGGVDPSRLRETLDAAMLADPAQWRAYHAGAAPARALARAFSFSDRARYYLRAEAVRDAVYTLLRNLGTRTLPPSLLSQYLPVEYEAVQGGELRCEPIALVRHHIGTVLAAYWAAARGSA
jgi:D-tagatose-1,6-bisphosphate aldolase subunit GatZ/KbaZ